MQRLKNKAQFQAVMDGGTVARSAHFALHRTGLDGPALPAPEAPGASEPARAAGSGPVKAQALFAVQACWVGALVPKRWARRAVTRNAIRRQIYAVAAEHEAALPAAAHVVRLRAAFDRVQFPSASSDALKRAVRAELRQLLHSATRVRP